MQTLSFLTTQLYELRIIQSNELKTLYVRKFTTNQLLQKNFPVLMRISRLNCIYSFITDILRGGTDLMFLMIALIFC